MVIIGVDPHKRTHTASSVEPATNKVLASMQVDASFGGIPPTLRWASRFSDRRWAIENARGLGRHLAQWLVARGEAVVDVPSTATARVRELSRGGRRKSDTIDASAAASVAALRGDANPIVAEDLTTVLALLDERRANVTVQRTRLINQLHALLRDLVPGGAPTDLSSATAQRAMNRAVERHNTARFVPVGDTRELAAAALRLVVEALVEDDSAVASAILDQVQPESSDNSVPTVSACIGITLRLLDDWLGGHDPTTPIRLADWVRLPEGAGSANAPPVTSSPSRAKDARFAPSAGSSRARAANRSSTAAPSPSPPRSEPGPTTPARRPVPQLASTAIR